MMRLIPFAVVFAMPGSLAAAEPTPQEISLAAAGVREIIGHRGSCANAPANTLAGLRQAIEARAHVGEIDIRTTQDGHLICMHDAEVDATTNGRGKIAEMKFEAIRALDAGMKFDGKFRGERVPTLREMLREAKGKIGVMLDLKEDGDEYIKKIVAEVREFGEPKRLVLGVRSLDHVKAFAKLLPEARQIGLISTTDDLEAFAKAGVPVIRLWPKWLADETLVPRVRKVRCELHLGTGLGTKAEVLPLLIHKPESLSSDDPAQLIKTLAELRK